MPLSGKPFSPSHTRKNTSLTPRFFRSVSTFNQYLADSPPPAPGQIPRMSLWLCCVCELLVTMALRLEPLLEMPSW